ncbi:MAG: glycosyltransferase [Propionivibrio sp.]
MSDMTAPKLTVVIPVYNEEATLPALFARLYASLDALCRPYEVIFINDGSRDKSAAILADQYHVRPEVTRVVLFSGNYGQHRAILAGFAHARGEHIVTLDADLQNPPEDIHLLLAAMDDGHDYVGSIRRQRNDSWWRRAASRAMNALRERITRIHMTDQGCMMRAYSRRIVDTVNQCNERDTFIPALAYSFAQNPTEVSIGHEERYAGESKYSLYSLIRLNFDLMTGFSVVPLQFFSMLGMLISLGSGVLVAYLLARRAIIGPEEGGLFTLFAITFFLLGIALFGVGILGEYVGRIYREVRDRPRYLISAVLQQEQEPEQNREEARHE